MSGGGKPVLVRAVGPGLQPYLPNGTALAGDPRLDLYNASSTLVESNDNWGGSSALSIAFAGAGAFPLAVNSRDAALLVTLATGLYSAQLSGADGGSGEGLVEVFEVP